MAFGELPLQLKTLVAISFNNGRKPFAGDRNHQRLWLKQQHTASARPFPIVIKFAEHRTSIFCA